MHQNLWSEKRCYLLIIRIFFSFEVFCIDFWVSLYLHFSSFTRHFAHCTCIGPKTRICKAFKLSNWTRYLINIKKTGKMWKRTSYTIFWVLESFITMNTIIWFYTIFHYYHLIHRLIEFFFIKKHCSLSKVWKMKKSLGIQLKKSWMLVTLNLLRSL